MFSVAAQVTANDELTRNVPGGDVFLFTFWEMGKEMGFDMTRVKSQVQAVTIKTTCNYVPWK